jgi:hypothetical protein
MGGASVGHDLLVALAAVIAGSLLAWLVGEWLLRETIRANKTLGWRATPPDTQSTEERPTHNPPTHSQGFNEYLAFKSLVEYVAVLLEHTSRKRVPLRELIRRKPTDRRQEADVAIGRLLAMTDLRRYTSAEKPWWRIAIADLELGEWEHRAPSEGS